MRAANFSSRGAADFGETACGLTSPRKAVIRFWDSLYRLRLAAAACRIVLKHSDVLEVQRAIVVGIGVGAVPIVRNGRAWPGLLKASHKDGQIVAVEQPVAVGVAGGAALVVASISVRIAEASSHWAAGRAPPDFADRTGQIGAGLVGKAAGLRLAGGRARPTVAKRSSAGRRASPCAVAAERIIVDAAAIGQAARLETIAGVGPGADAEHHVATERIQVETPPEGAACLLLRARFAVQRHAAEELAAQRVGVLTRHDRTTADGRRDPADKAAGRRRPTGILLRQWGPPSEFTTTRVPLRTRGSLERIATRLGRKAQPGSVWFFRTR